MGQDPDASSPARFRIGLFGGTFDPPHNGHLAVARDVADALALDRVLWIPAGEPPHKSGDEVTAATLRLEMVRAATAGHSVFDVSEAEVDRGGPSYTVDTLRSLRGTFPDALLFFIIGADEYRALESWRAPEQVLDLAHLAVMDRDGARAADEVPDVRGADSVHFVRVGRIDISSTEIRRHVAAGHDVTDFVPAAVAAIIGREGLYAGRSPE
jgi:nicotinate-nucleotide adenylyltransferase